MSTHVPNVYWSKEGDGLKSKLCGLPGRGHTGLLSMRQCVALTCAGAYAERIASLAVGGVYVLAGVPETVELCLNVAGGLVDTHVLMTLAALGLLALGQASEVS